MDEVISCDQKAETMSRFLNAHESSSDIMNEIKLALLAGHSINEPNIKLSIFRMKRLLLACISSWPPAPLSLC